MLIISILAAAIIPAVVSQMDAAARTKEAKDLSAFADALQASILRTGYIPTATDWAAAIANEEANAASNVSTNQRRFARAYLINTNLSLARPGDSRLPYQQGTNGIARPINATLMIVGSTRGHLPMASGAPSAAAFTELWNTPAGQKPATWTTYRGSGDDLLVQRINLEPLFCRLILHNLSTNGQPHFQINAATAVPLTNSFARESYYLKGTVVGLFSNNTILQVREILRDDTHRVFDGTFWRDQLLQGSVSTAAATSSGIASQFLAASPPYGNDAWERGHHHYKGKGNTSPAGVAAMLYGYMFAYTAWSSQSPCFGYDDSSDDGKGEKSSHRNMMDKVFDEFEHGANLFDKR